MRNQPLVSFIVNACDTDADMLRECIESIMSLSLSRQEREIILVDDGSTMTPLNELGTIADDILYIRQRRLGISAARNMGLKMATGRFIQFIGGSDRLIGAPYEHCLDIARYHNPDIVFFHATTKESVGGTPFTYDGPTSGSEYMRQNNIRGAVWGYIFERTLLGSLRFTPDIMHEDEDFTPQLFIRSERFYSTESEAYLHRERHSSTGAGRDHDDSTRLFADIERTLIHLQGLIVPDADRAALNRRIAQLTMDYLVSIIRHTHSISKLNATMERLHDKGLYPLPDRDYTKKYKYFRKMISNPLTRRLLFVIIRK